MAADRAALAIDHARLYLGERDARREAERSNERLRALQRISDAALSYLPLEELLTTLLDRVADILDSDTAAFLLLDESSQTLVARAAKGIEEEVEQGVRIPLGQGLRREDRAERHADLHRRHRPGRRAEPVLRRRASTRCSASRSSSRAASPACCMSGR